MSRCLIYKVHTAPQRRAFILPRSLAFVKDFFQVFQLFSSSHPRPRGASAALSDSSIRLPHPGPLVKHFFPLPRNFFSRAAWPDPRPSAVSCAPPRPASPPRFKTLDYITRLPLPCQPIFSDFSRFFHIRPKSAPGSVSGGHLTAEFSIARRHRL